MGRRPASDVTVPHTVRGTVFQIATSTLQHLPDAPAFLTHLLDKGLASHIAPEYVRLAAKGISTGRSGRPELITKRNERTAINAYWEWIETAYLVRLTPVITAFARTGPYVRDGITRLRRGSLVGPFDNKRVPSGLAFNTGTVDGTNHTVTASSAPTVTWIPCPNKWTLHVPMNDDVPVHIDPCPECAVIELDADLLEIIAVTFEQAWGHRELNRVPPECFLFGQPPRTMQRTAREAVPVGKIAACVPPGALADAVMALGGSSTRELDVFLLRLKEENPDLVVLDRESCSGRLEETLSAIRAAWVS